MIKPGDLVSVKAREGSAMVTKQPGDGGFHIENNQPVFTLECTDVALVLATYTSDLGPEAMILFNNRFGWAIQASLNVVKP